MKGPHEKAWGEAINDARETRNYAPPNWRKVNAMTDEQMLHEALKALKLATLLPSREARAICRAAMTKLQEYLRK